MYPGLSALVVHDLKNRLAVHEQRLAELLADHPGLDATLGPLHLDAVALRRRLVTFLTVYGADTGILSVNEQEEDPAHTLAHAARFAAVRTARRTLRIEVDTSASLGMWFFDAYLVGLALEAAVDNAARFAATRIRLDAAVRREHGADMLVIGVEDDGPGPGADTADAASREPPRRSDSTGLGHALCRTVAALHRIDGRTGDVALLDRRGAGGLQCARFEIRLP
jgi:K+-sensing histidine kinase KdpD